MVGLEMGGLPRESLPRILSFDAAENAGRDKAPRGCDGHGHDALG